MPVFAYSNRINNINVLGRVKFGIQDKRLNIPYIWYISANYTKWSLDRSWFSKCALARVNLFINTVSVGGPTDTSTFLKTTTGVTTPILKETLLELIISSSFQLQTNMIQPVASVVNRKLIVVKSVESLLGITFYKVLNPASLATTIKKWVVLTIFIIQFTHRGFTPEVYLTLSYMQIVV
jgi:hypothetical protein